MLPRVDCVVNFSHSRQSKFLRNTQPVISLPIFERELERDRPTITEDGDVLADRDAARKFIKDCLLTDVLTILVSRGDMTVADATSTSQTMKWTAWTDYAYENQMQIENWDDEMAEANKIPRKGFTINFFQDREKKRLLPALDARHFPDEDDRARAKLAESSLRVVSWTDAEMALSLEEQGTIPVLVSLGGVSIRTVSNSEKWLKVGARKKEKADNTKKKKLEQAAGKATSKKKTGPARSPPRRGDSDDEEERRVVATTQAAPPRRRTSGPSRQHEMEETPANSRAGRSREIEDTGFRRGARDDDEEEEELESRGRRGGPETSSSSRRRGRGGHDTPEELEWGARKNDLARNRSSDSKHSKNTADERRELLASYQRAEAEEQREASRTATKFRIYYGGESSTGFYGKVVKLQDGERQSKVEVRMMFWDKNVDSWEYLPRNQGCLVSDPEQQKIYNKWVKRFALE
ncbi:hypothetical protein B0H12DRAFT_1082170 [Mycena haematopus]|nr:hypothetical protein B0H12DRAFT_1082170 [Mycena haematopus]